MKRKTFCLHLFFVVSRATWSSVWTVYENHWMMSSVTLGGALQSLKNNPHFIITDWAWKSKAESLIYKREGHSLKAAAFSTQSGIVQCLVLEVKLILPTENIRWLIGESSQKFNNYVTKYVSFTKSQKVRAWAHKSTRKYVHYDSHVHFCR